MHIMTTNEINDVSGAGYGSVIATAGTASAAAAIGSYVVGARYGAMLGSAAGPIGALVGAMAGAAISYYWASKHPSE